MANHYGASIRQSPLYSIRRTVRIRQVVDHRHVFCNTALPFQAFSPAKSQELPVVQYGMLSSELLLCGNKLKPIVINFKSTGLRTCSNYFQLILINHSPSFVNFIKTPGDDIFYHELLPNMHRSPLFCFEYSKVFIQLERINIM
jgi:hypothetical protein